jgi:hypothetical protein
VVTNLRFVNLYQLVAEACGFIMGKNFLSQAERSQITLTSELKNILIGLLLGDLYLQKTPKSTKITFAVLF